MLFFIEKSLKDKRRKKNKGRKKKTWKKAKATVPLS
jgi:hypothetical protein